MLMRRLCNSLPPGTPYFTDEFSNPVIYFTLKTFYLMKNEPWRIAPLKWAAILFAFLIPFTSCDDDDNIDERRTFTVTIQNVSTATTLQPGAMPDRTAPLSPGVWAVYDDNSVFDLNSEASLGIERLAEEGSPSILTADLTAASWVEENGEFSSPGGPDNGPAIAAGEAVSFTFDAEPGDKLQFLTMFGQSNDWFYAFDDGGLDLFNNNTAIDGDITSHVDLYDAGTEVDEAPGLGVTQKPDHPLDINIGPVDLVDEIREATTRHAGLIIPTTSSVIRVTVVSSL
jgi:hypothetical protein